MNLTLFFLAILLYISLVPIFYIISKRFLERGLFLSNTYAAEYNAGLVCCVCLALSIIALRYSFFLNNWCTFIINFDYLLMIFSPTITISIVSLGFLISVSLVFFFKEVRCEEYLVLLYTIVFIVCVSAAFDFISIFVLLECINICTYILIGSGALNLISIYSSLKYVMVAIISTCFLLIGIVLLYLQYSHFNIISLKLIFRIEYLLPSVGLTSFSIIMIFVSFLIKLGVFPFYKWLIDVYGGFNAKAVLLVSTLLKMSSLVVLMNMIQSVGLYSWYYGIFFKFIGLASMLLGGIGAVFEWKLNRFVAFAGLFSMGTVFLIITQTKYSTNIVIYLYMVIYNISIIYLILVFNSCNVNNDGFFFILSQSNIYNLNQVVSVGHLVNIYSLINLPPFAGFYPKLFISYLLFSNGEFFTLFCMLIISMLGVVFFIKLYMIYFTEILIKLEVEIELYRYFSSLEVLSLFVIAFNFSVVLVSTYFLVYM